MSGGFRVQRFGLRVQGWLAFPGHLWNASVSGHPSDRSIAVFANPKGLGF